MEKFLVIIINHRMDFFWLSDVETDAILGPLMLQ